MSTFISIYVIIGLIFAVWINYKLPYTEYLRRIGKPDTGLAEIIFVNMAIFVTCISMWPLLLYVSLRITMKGVK